MRDKNLSPARFFPRAAAYLLDRLIIGAVLFLPRLIDFFRNWGIDAIDRAVLFRFTAGDILWWMLGCIYFIILTAGTGATLGKRAMGLRVVTITGEKPGWVTVLCRETFGRYLSSLLYIGYFLCLVDPERGALHDRICDTMVVTTPLPESRSWSPPTVRVPAPDRASGSSPALPSGNDWYAPNL